MKIKLLELKVRIGRDGMMNNTWYNVGVIVNTHGIRGDLKVLSKTDFAEERFAIGNKLRMFNEQSGQSQEITITASREQKGLYVIHLKGYDNINDVEQFKGWVIKVSAEEQGSLDDGEYFYHEIIGCEVFTDAGQQLGVISEVLSPGANDVWVVEQPKGKGKPILLPVIDPVILKVDTVNKRITVHLIEGLI